MDSHPSWEKLHKMITNGIEYPLNPINEQERLDRLNFNIKRGNHPTHSPEAELKLNEFVFEELGKGFLLPIPKEKVKEIPNAEVCPMHIVRQTTIDEDGKEKIKYRPCHDLSYSPRHLPDNSINKRYIEEELHNIQYAFTLWRILHFLVAL